MSGAVYNSKGMTSALKMAAVSVVAQMTLVRNEMQM